MSRDTGRWLGKHGTAAGSTRRAGGRDSLEDVHRAFDDRNIGYAMELILASPDAEAIVEELRWWLARRGRATG